MRIRPLNDNELSSLSSENWRLWSYPNQSRWNWLVSGQEDHKGLPRFRFETDEGAISGLILTFNQLLRRADMCICDESGEDVASVIRQLLSHMSEQWGVEQVFTRLPIGDPMHAALVQAGFSQTARLREHLRIGANSFTDVAMYFIQLSEE